MTTKPKRSTLDRPGAGGRIKLLSMMLAEAEYVFPLHEISRIIPADGVEKDPIAPGFVFGAMTSGEKRVAVLDLRTRLGLAPANIEDLNGRSVVIVDLGDVPVGFLIDAVGSLFDTTEDSIQGCRWVDDLAQSHKHGLGFMELEDRSMEVLSFEGILSEKDIASIANWRNSEDAVLHIAMRDERLKRQAMQEAMASNPLRHHAGSYLVVRVGEHLLGIKTSFISEVLPNDSLVKLPLTDEQFSGVLLLRGSTYPVIDLRRRLGLPEHDTKDARPAIVLAIDGDGFSGLFVQQIVQLSQIEVRQIQPAEDADIGIHRYLVTAGARLDVGPVTLIDVPRLLKDAQPSLLDASREILQQSGQNTDGEAPPEQTAVAA